MRLPELCLSVMELLLWIALNCHTMELGRIERTRMTPGQVVEAPGGWIYAREDSMLVLCQCRKP